MVRIGKWKEKKESMLKVFSWLKKKKMPSRVLSIEPIIFQWL